MKKLAFLIAIFVISCGCVYVPYQDYYADQHRRYEEPSRGEQGSMKPSPDKNGEKVVRYGPAYEQRRDLYFETGLDAAAATSIVYAAVGAELPDSLVDISVGMGTSLYTSAFSRFRVFLRDRESAPYLWLSYVHTFESDEIEFEEDHREATYKYEEAEILGYGFGYQWFINPAVRVNTQLGYYNLIDGGHLQYVDGDTPTQNEDLYDDAKAWKPGGSMSLALALEFRF